MTYRRRGNEGQEKREQTLQYTRTNEKRRKYERERKLNMERRYPKRKER